MATPDQATGIPTGNTDRITVRKGTVMTDTKDAAPEAMTGTPDHPDTNDGTARHGAGTTVDDSQTDVRELNTAAGAPATVIADAARVTIGYDDPLPDIKPDTQAGRTTEMKEGNSGTPHRDVTHHVARRDPK